MPADFPTGSLPSGWGSPFYRCILGLGNPGTRYEGTRHNIGCDVVDALAHATGASPWIRSSLALVAELRDERGLVLLAKPTTFMNLSGYAAEAILRGFELSPRQLVVVCDDVQLPVGRIRLRSSGSGGGQNGLQSVIDILQTDDVPRLRCGIGPMPRDADLARYVLSPFSTGERAIVSTMIGRAVEAVLRLLEKGIESAMSEFNARPADGPPPSSGPRSET